MISVEINHNSVVIRQGTYQTVIPRQQYIGVVEWMSFWEAAGEAARPYDPRGDYCR
jgi:hypothetical protein